MTLYAVPGPSDATPSPALAPAPPHEHAWHLVQVEYSDGCCVREFACGTCADVWFA